MSLLSSAQIQAMAPDAASFKAGQSLAQAKPWKLLGANERALWGLCQGSGSQPYQTSVDLHDLASNCSCPSRKFPCKHALGLMLLRADRAQLFNDEQLPAFTDEWLAKREQQQAKKQAKLEQAEAKPVSDPEVLAKAAERRQAQRDNRIEDGLNELRRWIEDLIDAGLGHAKIREHDFWDTRIRRLYDAQAPGMAARLANLMPLCFRPDWPTALLGEFALIHLACESWTRQDELPPALAADLKRAIGIPQRTEDLDPQSALDDLWFVAGINLDYGERLTTRRTWLRGLDSGRDAAFIDFALPKQQLPPALPVNACARGALMFYPAGVPLRAQWREQPVLQVVARRPDSDIARELDRISQQQAMDPWLGRTTLFPMAARGKLQRIGSGFALVDAGHRIPVVRASRENDDLSLWQWYARTARQHDSMWFGEWATDGLRLLNGWDPT